LVLPGAFGGDRGGAVIDCPLQLHQPLDIEYRIVLAGKRGIAAVLPQRR